MSPVFWSMFGGLCTEQGDRAYLESKFGLSLCLHGCKNENTNERCAKYEGNLRNRRPAAASRWQAYSQAFGRPVAAPAPLFRMLPLRRGVTLSLPMFAMEGVSRQPGKKPPAASEVTGHKACRCYPASISSFPSWVSYVISNA